MFEICHLLDLMMVRQLLLDSWIYPDSYRTSSPIPMSRRCMFEGFEAY